MLVNCLEVTVIRSRYAKSGQSFHRPEPAGIKWFKKNLKKHVEKVDSLKLMCTFYNGVTRQKQRNMSLPCLRRPLIEVVRGEYVVSGAS